jgi:hypothetical protein
MSLDFMRLPTYRLIMTTDVHSDHSHAASSISHNYGSSRIPFSAVIRGMNNGTVLPYEVYIASMNIRMSLPMKKI